LTAQGKEFRVSSNKLKIKYLESIGKDGQVVEVHMEMLRVSDSTCCAKFGYRDPLIQADLYDHDTVKHFLSVRGNDNLRVFCDATFEAEAQPSPSDLAYELAV